MSQTKPSRWPGSPSQAGLRQPRLTSSSVMVPCLEKQHHDQLEVNANQWRIQDFPEGAAPTPKNAIIFQFFCRKLHENERIWTPGGRASLAPPLDPPMPCMQLQGPCVITSYRPEGKVMFSEACVILSFPVWSHNLFWGGGLLLEGDLPPHLRI